MTDWLSAGAMLLAGIIVGVVFLYGMKTRKKDDGGPEQQADAEAGRQDSGGGTSFVHLWS